MSARPRRSSWAWLVPVLAIVSMPDSLRQLGAGSHDRGVAWALVIGVVAGVFWYWRYPRPLAERLRPLATVNLVLFVVVVIGSVEDGAGEFTLWDVGPPAAYGVLGVLTALVLAEHFHHVLLDRRARRARQAERERRTTEKALDGPPVSS